MADVFRDTLITVVATVVAATGLIGLMALPWTISVPASVLVGVGAVLFDRLVLRRTQLHGSPHAFKISVALSAVAWVASLALAFSLGRQFVDEPNSYAFLTDAAGTTDTPMYLGPATTYRINSIAPPGWQISVECAIIESGEVWYKTSGMGDWVKAEGLMRAPRTGDEMPPDCPS